MPRRTARSIRCPSTAVTAIVFSSLAIPERAAELGWIGVSAEQTRDALEAVGYVE